MTSKEAETCRWCGQPIVDRHCPNPSCDWCAPCVNKKHKEARP